MAGLTVEVSDEQFVHALVRHWTARGEHPRRPDVCPPCGQELKAIGIAKLAYTFEVCECGEPEYSHLVEQLWHRDCLKMSTTTCNEGSSE